MSFKIDSTFWDAGINTTVLGLFGSNTALTCLANACGVSGTGPSTTLPSGSCNIWICCLMSSETSCPVPNKLAALATTFVGAVLPAPAKKPRNAASALRKLACWSLYSGSIACLWVINISSWPSSTSPSCVPPSRNPLAAALPKSFKKTPAGISPTAFCKSCWSALESVPPAACFFKIFLTTGSDTMSPVSFFVSAPKKTLSPKVSRVAWGIPKRSAICASSLLNS